MQDRKESEFNPLDILATAAALKQTDKKEIKPKIVIVKPKEGAKIINPKPTSKSENEKKETPKRFSVLTTSSFVQDGVKKVKLKISPELEKMLNEHNYGSIQKVNSGNKAFKLPDVLSLGGQDKKVIVKLVEKSGVHSNRDKILTGVNIKGDKNSPGENPVNHTNNDYHKENKTDIGETQSNRSECLDTLGKGISKDSVNPLNEEYEEEKDQCVNTLKEEDIQPSTSFSGLIFNPQAEESKEPLCSKSENISDNVTQESEDSNGLVGQGLNSLEKDQDSVDTCSEAIYKSLVIDERGDKACFSVPVCKPVVEDFDVCTERIDTDIRSPVYEDIDLNDSQHKTPPNDEKLLESNTSKDQILKIDSSCENDKILLNQDVQLLTNGENSISSAVKDRTNTILEKDEENQYGDNKSLPGIEETGVNNTDRCDMGKSQVLDKVQATSYSERRFSQNSSESGSGSPSASDDRPKLPFSMIDHEYCGKFCEDSSDIKESNSQVSDISFVNEFSQDSGFSDSGLSPDGLESRTFRRDSPSLIPIRSDMLPSFDLNEINKARDAIVAIANANNVTFTSDNVSPTKTSPKVGKFSIGTFASVCNSSLGLQIPNKNQASSSQRIVTSLLTNKPCPQNKMINTGAMGLIDHIEHDHDYSLHQSAKPSNIPFPVHKVDKEVTGKGKTKERKGDGSDKRNRRSHSSEDSKEDKLFNMITSDNEKKLNKQEKLTADLLKTGSSDSKLKIQGSYKDDFVYFLNTNFRSRRRTSQDLPPPIPPDRILVPLPKPGDIIVPHLTNEDLEAIKLGKTVTLPSGQQISGNAPIPSQAPPVTVVPAQTTPKTSTGIEDMENCIVNTILSMESDTCSDTTDTGLFSAANDSFGINFSDQLTPEQMEILYSAVDEVQMCDKVGGEVVMGGDVTSQADGNLQDSSKTEMMENETVQMHEDVTSSAKKLEGDVKAFPEPQETKLEEKDDGAPWIVTVSMYWNDLPAIMLDNIPFIRLVDIHKQILPAKDTGILKKRCQLLGVEVKNCTEMQRYFLVQYGKAFNSKSNLIISKDNAEFLVGYYVNPVTKLPRVEEHRPKPRVRKVSRPRPRPPSRTESDKRDIPVPPPVIEQLPPPPAPLGRTRHKKINFLELLKGDTSQDVSDTTEEKKSEGKVSVVVVDPPSGWKKSDDHSNVRKKRLHSVDTLKKKSEKCQTIECLTDEDIENRDEKSLTWLSKKRQKLPIKMSKKLKKPGSLKVKWTIFNKAKSKKLSNKKNQRAVLSVVHKDVSPNGSHINNIQPGNVFMDLYNNSNSPCVRCCTCSKNFTIDAFLTHQHDVTDNEKLVLVVSPQALSLRESSEAQKKMWRNFQLKRKRFNNKISVVQNGLQNKIHRFPVRPDNSDKTTLLVRPPTNKSVRISSRKRKQKQLYPIENYSYGANARHSEISDELLVPSPNKMIKVGLCLDDNTENVVAKSNGPLLTSFTALEHDL